jgi:hypothetical protein
MTAAAAAAAASKPRVLISLSLLYVWQGKASRRAAAWKVRSGDDQHSFAASSGARERSASLRLTDLVPDQNVNGTVYVLKAAVNTLFISGCTWRCV